ncbi:MAG TPA: hypothetical protein VEB21_03320, partial [Terriglobales bacterium]|nr:hypothetical protein [Terriglobales bacterium]
FDELRQRFAERGIELHGISAATGEGVAELIKLAGYRSRELKLAQLASAPAESDEERAGS